MTGGFKCRYSIFLWCFLWCGAWCLFADSNTVTIERARSTSYYTDEATEDEIIVFSGDVVISVAQGKSTSRIQADQVNFNRSQGLLYASGSVTLERNTGSGNPETLHAESLLFNINTEEGIFNSGTVIQSDSGALKLDTQSQMVVSAELFARDDSGVIAFKSGSLTFCEDPDPHWKINASRIWLLPGNEFAFANALLYVGKVPIMYFPFFYYPKDELVFNPVFGFDQRKGYFIQTTTYFIGRKKPSETKDDDSFFSFLNNSTLYKQRREGLVLRNLEETDTEKYPHTLKLLADYYTNLGGLVGIDGVFTPENSSISKLDFSLNLGFSRNLYPVGNGIGIYVPYDELGKTYYNSSYFAGLALPFRYRGHFSMNLTKPFSLSIDLPLYSDPFFNQDFLATRGETMDWFNFLMSSGMGESAATGNSTGEIGSFLWKVTASISPTIPAVLKPYISSVSFSPGFNLNFYSLTDTSDMTATEAAVSPNRKSFYPGLIKPFFFTASISGTLFEYPTPEKATTSSGLIKQVPKNELNVPDIFLSQEEKEELLAKAIEEESSTDVGEANTDEAKEDLEGKISSEEIQVPLTEPVPTESALLELSLPLISVLTPSIKSVDNGFQYKLTYSASTNFSSEIGYSVPQKTADFHWSDINSTFVYLTVPAQLSSNLKYGNSLLGITNTLNFNPVFQRHPVYTDESKVQTIKRNDYSAQKMDLSNNNAVTLSPFVYNSIFSGTSISWNTNIRIIRTQFIGTADEPQWEYQLPEWDENSIATHNLTTTFKSQLGKFSQQLSYTAMLPPLRESHSGTITLGFPLITTSLSTGIQRRSLLDKEWTYQPIQQNLNLSLFESKLVLSESYQYNLEDSYPESFSMKLSGYGFSAAYVMQYISGYDYDTLLGWKLKNEKIFQPSHLELSYTSGSSKILYFWKNRVSLSGNLSTTIKFDFLRPTNSYLIFSPSISFSVYEFLTLTLKANSRNDVIYRYIQKATDFEPKIPGEENLFIDLWNSFAFWDENKRKASGFKLKSFDIALSHQLHDWTMSSQFSISPRIVTENGKRFYDFSPYFTLSVVWKPMNSMKTTIEDKYGTITLNP